MRLLLLAILVFSCTKKTEQAGRSGDGCDKFKPDWSKPGFETRIDNKTIGEYTFCKYEHYQPSQSDETHLQRRIILLAGDKLLGEFENEKYADPECGVASEYLDGQFIEMQVEQNSVPYLYLQEGYKVKGCSNKDESVIDYIGFEVEGSLKEKMRLATQRTCPSVEINKIDPSKCEEYPEANFKADVVFNNCEPACENITFSMKKKSGKEVFIWGYTDITESMEMTLKVD
jgi:hypothetical protein